MLLNLTLQRQKMFSVLGCSLNLELFVINIHCGKYFSMNVPIVGYQRT